MRRSMPVALALAAAGTMASAACSDATAPGDLQPLHFVQLSAGSDRTCAVTLTAELFCWGRRFNGDAASNAVNTPRRVPLPRSVMHVGVGENHSCAVLAGGEAVCWGDGAHGALGREEHATLTVPATGALADYTVATVAAGGGHSCAVSADGTALCWGRGLNGELGTGRIEETHRPDFFGRGFFRFREVSIGQHHSCGIELDGRVLCSGWNVHGQLGGGFTVNLGAPQHINVDRRFTTISAGRHHTCGVDEEGRAWCWGRGDHGQLGSGIRASALSPAPVPDDLRFAAIAAGDEHTCALTHEGAALCWGDNLLGRAGQPADVERVPIPAPVHTELRFTQISAGSLHTCALAADGRAFCWGFGGFGQLGGGTMRSSHTPVAVAPPRASRRG